jgi:5-hydroxyisourate hydrolase-like protein (transthyretin family)
MAMTTKTAAMMTTNVDDKASGASAQHFHIALRSGNDDNINYWQQRTTSVRRRGLVRERTTCGVA